MLRVLAARQRARRKNITKAIGKHHERELVPVPWRPDRISDAKDWSHLEGRKVEWKTALPARFVVTGGSRTQIWMTQHSRTASLRALCGDANPASFSQLGVYSASTIPAPNTRVNSSSADAASTALAFTAFGANGTASFSTAAALRLDNRI